MKTRIGLFSVTILLAGVASVITPSVRHTQAVVQTDVACNEPTLPDTFFARGESVLVRVSATDEDQKPIGCLVREDFQLREDQQLQRITFFSHDDVPVTVGLVVDSGTNMAAWHAGVVSALLAFVRSSRLEDEFFALAFNDEVHDVMSSDAPFTHQPAVFHDAILQMPVGGRSALYDAVDHGLDYAARGRLENRVLIVISAGGDTASRTPFASLVNRVAASPTVIYTIGIGHPWNVDGESGSLTQLASLSGGRAFLAGDSGDLSSILEWIAVDIRTSYTIGYMPPNVGDGARFRTLKVTLAGGNRIARLRHRDGYAGGIP